MFCLYRSVARRDMSERCTVPLVLLLLFLCMGPVQPAEYMGCYVDSSASRVLPWERATKTDIKSCGLHCKKNGYIYYGVEYSTECYCGTDVNFASIGTARPDSECNLPCPGNTAEMCGGSLRISVYRPGKIAAITASSHWVGNHGASNARLDFKEASNRAGAWVASENNANQWLLFDLGQRSTVGVIRTQGRQGGDQWVTSYSISYGNSSGDEMDYKDTNGDTIVFTGNSDRNSLVTHVLGDYNGPFHARYVKFYPVTWHGHISMRADIGEVAPVGFWPLNGHAQLRDVSGYGNDAIGVGVSLVNVVHGEIDGAYSLSGNSTSYIEIPNNGMLDTRYSITMLAYVYPTGTDGPIFNYRTDDFGVHLWQTGTNHLQGRMLTRSHVYKDPISVSTLNLNEWNFVGMTYSYPSGKVKLWHDGTEVGTLDVGTFETETDYDIRVGVTDGDSRILAGRIACLQIYNIPLNGEQIREAAAKCKAVQPVGLWPLNKQYSLADISGNGNDVTGSNVALGSGMYGEPEGAYVLSGSTTSYIEIPDDRTLDTRYSLTILASVYPTGESGPILHYGDSTTTGVHLWQDSTNVLLTRVFSRNATTNQTTRVRCIKPNQWNFVGLTYNYNSGILKLWYEGLELVSTDIGVYELGTNHAARIGAVGSDYFKGSVSCVQVYDVALNQSQIEHAATLCTGNNIAVGKTTEQSSVYSSWLSLFSSWEASNAVDGYKGSDENEPACAQTQSEVEPWWKLDLGGSYVVVRVRLLNRWNEQGERLEEFQVRVGENSDISQNSICGRTTNQLDDPPHSRSITVDCAQPITGRYVSVQLIDRTDYLTLCEVEVFEGQGNGAGWLTLDFSSVISSAGTPKNDGGIVYDAFKTLDGNLLTYWHPKGVTDNHYYVTLDLKEYYWLSKIRVVTYEEDDAATHHIAAFTIRTAVNTTGSWTDVTSFSGLAGRQVKAFTGFVAMSRYWQVDITQTSHGQEPYVAEIQLYGRPAYPPRTTDLLTFPLPKSTANYVKLPTSLSQPLTEITTCLHMRSEDTRLGAPVSYEMSSNDFVVYGNSADRIKVYVNNQQTTTFAVSILDGSLHFLCVTWSNTAGDWKVYVNGTEIASGSGLAQGQSIPSGGTWILGQEQDSPGGGFNAADAFAGEISLLNVWDRVLTEAEIGATCGGTAGGNIINWGRDTFELFGQVTTRSSAVECDCSHSRSTTDVKTYQWDMTLPGSSPLTFSVKANSDAHIALSSEGATLNDMYEIVIGGWSNTQSVIRRSPDGNIEATASTPGIVSANEFRDFWVSWTDDGTIAVGREGESSPFMQWRDPAPLGVGYFGYSTGYGSTGEFRFPCRQGKSLLMPSFYGFDIYKVPVSGFMTSANLRTACEAQGMQTVCWRANEEAYPDEWHSYCQTIPVGNGISSLERPQEVLAQHICGSVVPKDCAPLHNTFVARRGWRPDDGACGVIASRWCQAGHTQSNLDALCARVSEASSAVSLEEPTYHCNGDKPSYVTMATNGTITSGDHGWGNYSSDNLCSWTIEAPSGMAVSLTFLTFDLADDGDCLSDYVAVYDGSNQSSVLLGRFCESNPGVVNSTGTLMHVTFVSNSSLEASGFQATFGQIQTSSNASINPAYVVRGCEYATVTLSCPSGSVLHTSFANYGRVHRWFCGFTSSQTYCASDNAESVVRSACDNQQDCQVVASNSAFGDPCPGESKYLEVSYQCDFDECTTGNGGCSQNCTNTIGSFSCSCQNGYTLNGDSVSCDDIDECTTNNGGCPVSCNNTMGSFECFCGDGYILGGDGVSCEDVDECSSANGGCEQVCNNTEGSFQCSCHLGQTLSSDGLNCDRWDLPSSCPTDSYINLPNNKTYVSVSGELVDYATAQAGCTAVGGMVAVPLDWNEHAYLVFFKNCLDEAAQFWAGLTLSDGTWVDSQGTALGGFSAWAPGEPNGGKICSHLVRGTHTDSQRVNMWADALCTVNYRYICETSKSLLMPSFYGFDIYKVPVGGYMISANLRTACEAQGMQTVCWKANEASTPGRWHSYCQSIPVGTEISSLEKPQEVLAHHICGSINPKTCAPLLNTFVALRGWQTNDGACGVTSSTWCQAGQTLSNMDALCATALQTTTPPPTTPAGTTTTASTSTVIHSTAGAAAASTTGAGTTNIALNRPATQSSTSGGGDPGRAVDGDDTPMYGGLSCTHTAEESDPWWRVDLGSSRSVGQVVVTNRKDCCSDRLEGFTVYVGDNPDVTANPTCGGPQSVVGKAVITVNCGGLTGRYVGIALSGTGRIITLCEVEVFAASQTTTSPPTTTASTTTTAAATSTVVPSTTGAVVATTAGAWLSRDSSWVVDSAGTPYVTNGVTYDAAKALDGNTATYWNPGGMGRNYNNWYIILDLRAPQTLTHIAVNNYGDTTHDITAFTLQKSQVGSPYNWENAVSVTNVQGGTGQRQEFGGFQGTARYWKFVITRTNSGYQPWFTELNLGTSPGSQATTLPPTTPTSTTTTSSTSTVVPSTAAASTTGYALLMSSFYGFDIYKVPVSGYMISANLRTACEAKGMQTVCVRASEQAYPNFWYSYCQTIPVGNGISSVEALHEVLAHHICGSTNPKTCAPLHSTFVAVRGWQTNDGACGVTSSTWCQAGQTLSNMDALCARGSQATTLPPTTPTSTTTTASTSTVVPSTAAASTTAVHAACGGFFNVNDGFLKTPGHPEVYMNDLDCTWTITVDPGRQIFLTFANFSLESHSRCNYDYVQIMDGQGDSAVLLGKWCGTDGPPPLNSTNNTMTVYFHTDYSIVSTGFFMSWNSGMDGSRYHIFAYDSCQYYYSSIHQRNGPVNCRGCCSLNNSHSRCSYDYVQIMDGQGDSAVLLGKWCGTEVPPPLNCTNNTMTVYFHSDYSIVSTGFFLSWNSGPDWTQHGSNQYTFLESTSVTYIEARALCVAEGAILVMPKDQATHDFLVQYRNQFSSEVIIWVGLNDIEIEGNFVWEDGTSLGSFNPWMAGQPNNLDEQDCVVITQATNGYPNQWRDDDCSGPRGVICEKAVQTTTPPPTTPPTTTTTTASTSTVVPSTAGAAVATTTDIQTTTSPPTTPASTTTTSATSTVIPSTSGAVVATTTGAEFEWQHIAGGLTFVSVGLSGVWGVDSDYQIYYRTGTYKNEASPGTGWELIDGGLKQISSGNNTVWGVTSNDDIFIRLGISSSAPHGSRWSLISGKLKQVHVSSTSDQVWGVDSGDNVFRRTGITTSNLAGTSWQHISTSGGLKYVSIGKAGVWGVSSNDQIFYRAGTFENEASPGTEWVLVSGNLKQISSGNGEVWGVDMNNQIYVRRNISAGTPQGSTWQLIEGSLEKVSISSSSNQVWGVNATDNIYRRQGQPLTTPATTTSPPTTPSANTSATANTTVVSSTIGTAVTTTTPASNTSAEANTTSDSPTTISAATTPAPMATTEANTTVVQSTTGTFVTAVSAPTTPAPNTTANASTTVVQSTTGTDVTTKSSTISPATSSTVEAKTTAVRSTAGAAVPTTEAEAVTTNLPSSTTHAPNATAEATTTVVSSTAGAAVATTHTSTAPASATTTDADTTVVPSTAGNAVTTLSLSTTPATNGAEDVSTTVVSSKEGAVTTVSPHATNAPNATTEAKTTLGAAVTTTPPSAVSERTTTVYANKTVISTRGVAAVTSTARAIATTISPSTSPVLGATTKETNTTITVTSSTAGVAVPTTHLSTAPTTTSAVDADTTVVSSKSGAVTTVPPSLFSAPSATTEASTTTASSTVGAVVSTTPQLATPLSNSTADANTTVVWSTTGSTALAPTTPAFKGTADGSTSAVSSTAGADVTTTLPSVAPAHTTAVDGNTAVVSSAAGAVTTMSPSITSAPNATTDPGNTVSSSTTGAIVTKAPSSTSHAHTAAAYSIAANTTAVSSATGVGATTSSVPSATAEVSSTVISSATWTSVTTTSPISTPATNGTTDDSTTVVSSTPGVATATTPPSSVPSSATSTDDNTIVVSSTAGTELTTMHPSMTPATNATAEASTAVVSSTPRAATATTPPSAVPTSTTTLDANTTVASSIAGTGLSALHPSRTPATNATADASTPVVSSTPGADTATETPSAVPASTIVTDASTTVVSSTGTDLTTMHPPRTPATKATADASTTVFSSAPGAATATTPPSVVHTSTTTTVANTTVVSSTAGTDVTTMHPPRTPATKATADAGTTVVSLTPGAATATTPPSAVPTSTTTTDADTTVVSSTTGTDLTTMHPSRTPATNATADAGTTVVSLTPGAATATTPPSAVPERTTTTDANTTVVSSTAGTGLTTMHPSRTPARTIVTDANATAEANTMVVRSTAGAAVPATSSRTTSAHNATTEIGSTAISSTARGEVATTPLSASSVRTAAADDNTTVAVTSTMPHSIPAPNATAETGPTVVSSAKGTGETTTSPPTTPAPDATEETSTTVVSSTAVTHTSPLTIPASNNTADADSTMVSLIAGAIVLPPSTVPESDKTMVSSTRVLTTSSITTPASNNVDDASTAVVSPKGVVAVPGTPPSMAPACTTETAMDGGAPVDSSIGTAVASMSASPSPTPITTAVANAPMMSSTTRTSAVKPPPPTPAVRNISAGASSTTETSSTALTAVANTAAPPNPAIDLTTEANTAVVMPTTDAALPTTSLVSTHALKTSADLEAIAALITSTSGAAVANASRSKISAPEANTTVDSSTSEAVVTAEPSNAATEGNIMVVSFTAKAVVTTAHPNVTTEANTTRDLSTAGAEDTRLGWIRNGTEYYKIFTSRLDYVSAREACATEGGTLAMAKNEKKAAFLVNIRNNAGLTNRLWIGLNDIETEGSYVWEDGTPLGNFNRFRSKAQSDTKPCGLSAFRHVPQSGCGGAGVDIASLGVVTLQACADACCTDLTCLSFQYNINNRCYLKNKICSAGEKMVIQTVTLSLAIPITWDDSFEDRNSTAFKELEADVVSSISDLYNSIPGFSGVIVQRISRQDKGVAASIGVQFAGGDAPEEEQVGTVLITAAQSSALAVGGVAITDVGIGNTTETGNASLCDSFTCIDHAVCIEIAGEAKCVCQPGYEGNATIRCTDINECMMGAHVCIREELCFNREGSYACASCYPDIALVGGGANPWAPVDIKRRAPFTVQSTVTVECNVAYSFLFNWSLYSIDGGLPTKIALPENVETTGSELTLPKNVLPYGKVVVRLDVTVEETMSGLRVVMFAEQWVNVLSSALVADIAGGSAKSLARGSDIVLDASSSADPDAMVTNSADFTYNWTCVTGSGSSCDDLFGDGGTSQSYVISSSNLDPRVRGLTIQLGVRFQDRIPGTTSQTLEIFPVGSPSISIRCFSNCNRKINPSEKLVLVSECSNCEENEQVSYNWTLQEAPDEFGRSDLDWDTESTTGRNLPDVVIEPEIFTALGDYAFRVEASLDFRRQGFSEYRFEPNEPPVVGSCTVSPENGTAMVTEFIFTCTGFSDADKPLTYTFLFNTDAASTFSPLYTGTEAITPPQLLPVGQESGDFVVRIQAQVSDSLGATSTFETSVKVLALPAEQSTAVASQLVVGENSPLTRLVREGDAKSLVQMSNSVTSVLNTVPANASAEARKAATEAREALVSALTNIKPTSVSSVNLVASALGSATSGDDEVSADSQVAAASSLKNMAGFLQSIPPEDLEIGQIEKSSSFMFTAVVNVMAGSSRASDQAKSSEEGETDSDQLEKAKEATKNIFDAIDTMNGLMLNRKRPNEKPTVINQGPFEMALQRQNCRDMRPQIVRPSANSDTWFRIPDASALFGQSCRQSVGFENYHTSLNPYSYADNSDKIKSPVASLKFRSDSGPVGVNNLQVPIDVMMPQKPGAVVVQTERGETTPTGQDVMSMHSFNVTEADSSVHVTVTPDVEGIPVRLFLGINSAPSRRVYNWTTSVPLAVDSLYSIPLRNNTYLRPDPFQWFLSASDLELTGSEQLFLGVDHEPFTNDTTTNDTTVMWGDLSEALELGYGGVNFTLNYTLKIFTSKCLFFDEGQQQWSSEGCEIGPLTSTSLTHCLCNHLTAFGSDFQFFVAPNSLNILSALQGFANIGENPSVVITIGVLFGLYLLIVVWARWEDKKDVSKVGATVLRGAGRHSQSYQVQVFTGTRANAATSSQVFLVLKGEKGQSGPHVLEDRARITFKQGAVDTFVVTSPFPLGPLQSIHIWHNNIGPYPSWFLEQVIVTDLQEDAKHVFLCKSWLAVEEGDGKVDREVEKATDKDLTRFARLFSTKTSKDFRDGHLWFSVIGRPATSPFTRVQRVSCCLSLLMCTMLTNIMFFGKGDTMQKPPPVYILGFEVQFPISWGQIIIGIQSALMVIPVNLLIVQIFRNCAARPSRKIKGKPVDMRNVPRRDPEGRASSAVSSDKNDPHFARKSSAYEIPSERAGVSVAKDSAMIVQPAKEKESSHQTVISVDEVERTNDDIGNEEDEDYDATAMQDDLSKLAKKKKKRLLPWWCVFFAWFLVFATCSLSAFFTMLYGFEYGREKAEAWVLTFLTSFFFDLAISQPIKILLIGFLFALIIKKPDSLEDDVPPAQLYEDEEFVGQQSSDTEDLSDETAHLLTGPPDQGELAVAREQRLVELGLKEACYDFVFYTSYILLLLIIANGNRDQYMYRMSNHLRDTFADPFSEVNDFETFWAFVRKSMISDLHDVELYNETPLSRPGFLEDTSSFIVGHPRLRQVRVSPGGNCDVPAPMVTVTTDCDNPYGLLDSDDNSYDFGWTPHNVTFDVSNWRNASDQHMPWIYQPASLSAAVPDSGEHGTYYGGGYMVQLSNSSAADLAMIDGLQKMNWIDDNTRALFIEFIVYNANANLFAVFNLLAEFTNLGKSYPQCEIMVVRLYPYTTPWGFVLLGCHGVFFLITLYLTFREVRRILTLGREYFKMFWRVVELVLSMLALAEIGVHLYTAYLILGFNTSQKNGDGDQRYNKYKQAASWEKINTYLLGWLVCVACLKLLYLCRFNKNIQRGPKVARKAMAPLVNFMIVFFIFFMAFSMFGYLVLGAKLSTYGTYIRTMQTLFSVMLGDMDYDTVKSVADILGPLMLLSFVIFMSNIVVLMFLAILCDAFAEVVDEEQIQGKSMNDKIKDHAMYRLRKLLQKKPSGFAASKHKPEAKISTICARPRSHPNRNIDGKSGIASLSEENALSENEFEQETYEPPWLDGDWWKKLQSSYAGKLDDPAGPSDSTWSVGSRGEKSDTGTSRRRSSTFHQRHRFSGIQEHSQNGPLEQESKGNDATEPADMPSSADVAAWNQQEEIGKVRRRSSAFQTRRQSSWIEAHSPQDALMPEIESTCNVTNDPTGSAWSVDATEDNQRGEVRTVLRPITSSPSTRPSLGIEDHSPNDASMHESNGGDPAGPVDTAWSVDLRRENRQGEARTDRRHLERQSTVVSFGGVVPQLPGSLDLEVEDVVDTEMP
ncbi:PKDREJ [Branchiostoma lanceolatum]|uniref:PKDREJ protein n=1 Tax=Branchiostoma lanceolatum TaxID=7740 RepID=A0A8K0ERK4_BRALA|nr:PKDREJ [Branchiostoma lanceolatum]